MTHAMTTIIETISEEHYKLQTNQHFELTYTPRGFPDDEVIVICHNEENDRFTIENAGTCLAVNVDFSAEKITWIGCDCGDDDCGDQEFDRDHVDYINAIKNQISIIAACKLFKIRVMGTPALVPGC